MTYDYKENLEKNKYNEYYTINGQCRTKDINDIGFLDAPKGTPLYQTPSTPIGVNFCMAPQPQKTMTGTSKKYTIYYLKTDPKSLVRTEEGLICPSEIIKGETISLIRNPKKAAMPIAAIFAAVLIIGFIIYKRKHK